MYLQLYYLELKVISIDYHLFFLSIVQNQNIFNSMMKDKGERAMKIKVNNQ